MDFSVAFVEYNAMFLNNRSIATKYVRGNIHQQGRKFLNSVAELTGVRPCRCQASSDGTDSGIWTVKHLASEFRMEWCVYM